ncbi:hypothetical protein HOR86_gp002 [Escherichia phage OSYSP]|uniref:Uncharacterized protein n=1 Tax=Escherichia phage OSYSP TaxID=2020879 RepID=A0A221J820_9CAUD|nr:hypothetical protein HOR86_gp002 [Escherichia phage OSYSP]ASM62862.1 hypothetical protein OSY_002 [Escherichia phage OSYSP]
MLPRSINVEAKTLDSHCLSVSNHVVATDLEDRNVKIKVPVLIYLIETINLTGMLAPPTVSSD